jgi:hypothetical protein
MLTKILGGVELITFKLPRLKRIQLHLPQRHCLAGSIFHTFMRPHPWIVVACVATSAAYAPSKLPKDVAAFRADREQCDHFRGEEPYDDERRRSLAVEMQRFCKGSDAALSRLKKKYGKNRGIRKILNGYEPRIE